MKAKLLLAHSIRQVFGNLAAAVRISGLLYIIQWSVEQVLGMTVAKALGPASAKGGVTPDALAGVIGPAFVMVVVVMVTDFWIAVAWHRYVLKQEASAGILPLFDGPRILGYFGTGFLIAAIMLAPVLVVGSLVGGTVTGLLGGGLISLLITQVVVQTLLGAFAFRLSTVLAGVALEPGHRIGEGWRATDGETMIFLELTFYCALALTAVDLADSLLSGVAVLELAFNFVAQWTVTMVGISILTTLYGHYIQKRPLV